MFVRLEALSLRGVFAYAGNLGAIRIKKMLMKNGVYSLFVELPSSR